MPLGLTVFFASLHGTVTAGSPLVAAVAWAPSLGVDLAFRVDGLALLFALLISGIGTLVVVYAGGAVDARMIPAWIHGTLGVVALVSNACALVVEARLLARNNEIFRRAGLLTTGR